MSLDLSTLTLLVLVGVMGLNQLVMRVGGLYARPAVFWSLQALNVAVASFLLLWGLPGFESWPVVSWMLALFFVFRTVQNTNLRAGWLRGEVVDERERRRKEIQDALRRGEEEEETP